MTIFVEKTIENPDVNYTNHRDWEGRQEVRLIIDKMVHDLEAYCGDRNIKQKFQENFFPFVWQFYLGYCLKESGFDLIKTDSEGPDFSLSNGVIVEAVLATRGEGNNRTYSVLDSPGVEIEPGFTMYEARVSPFPNESIMLRLTSSIESKLNQYNRWKENNVINKNSPFIIGLNSFLIDNVDTPDSISYGARVCYGIGCSVITIPVSLGGNSITNTSDYKKNINYLPEIINLNNSIISSNIFHLEKYKDVSALAYSHKYIGNCLDSVGSDIEIILNPNANSPIDVNCFVKFTRIIIEYSDDRKSFTLVKIKAGELFSK